MAFSGLKSQNVQINVSDSFGIENEIATVSFTVENFLSIIAMQLTIEWDPEQLTFLSSDNYGIENLGESNFGISNIEDGYITFLWDDPDLIGQSSADGQILFTLDFQVNGTVGSSSPISITADPTDIIFLNSSFATLNYETTSGSISVLNPLVVSILQITETPCPASTDGIIEIEVSGGLPPYSYLWNSGHSSNIISNLPSGNYIVTVTDGTGEMIISNPIEIESVSSLDLSVTTNICDADVNSTLAMVSGGSPPYEIQWSTSDSGSIVFNLSSGFYVVTVTDSENCAIEEEFEIPNIQHLTINWQITKVSCNEGNDGSIELEIFGGIPPFSFSWNNGEVTQNISNLEAGSYIVNISNENGCSTTRTIVVPEPLDLNVEINTVNATSETNGNAEVTLNGGTPPYTISWSNNQFGENAIELEVGNYSVVIIDANGCSKTVFFDIFLMNNMNALNPNHTFTIFPNPTQDLINISIDPSFQEKVIWSIFDNKGQIQINNSITSLTKNSPINLSCLPSGVYWLKVNEQIQKIIKY